MAETSSIEWTDATWNPITGCSVLTPGCTNCYAMKLAGTRLRNHPSREGLTKHTKAGPVWTGEVRFNEGWLTQPLQWRRPRMVFVCAHGDLFHEDVPDAWIDRVFAVMALARQHAFQVLTKRAERMHAYVSGVVADQQLGLNRFGITALATGLHGPAGSLPAWPLPNVWLGISAERQKEADERIPHLLRTPAAVRFLSLEPLLGPINLTRCGQHYTGSGPLHLWQAGGEKRWRRQHMEPAPEVDWVIVGGESGDGARPMHPDWARDIRDQCDVAGVPLFFKQWGAWEPNEFARVGNHGEIWRRTPSGREHWFMDECGKLPGEFPGVRMSNVGKKIAGRLLDGVEHNGMPPVTDLRAA